MDEQARWRPRPPGFGQQRHICRFQATREDFAEMSDVSGRGVFVTTPQRPPLGSRVRIRHMRAGTIEGAVSAYAADGISVKFNQGARATAFALAVIASGMAAAS